MTWQVGDIIRVSDVEGWDSKINEEDLLAMQQQLENGEITVEEANKWAENITLTLSGDITGSVTFDGSGNITLTGNVRKATQAEAEAGTSNTVFNTPLRTGEQIRALRATADQAQLGENNTQLMTPLRTAQTIAALSTYKQLANNFDPAETKPITDYPQGTSMFYSITFAQIIVTHRVANNVGYQIKYTGVLNVEQVQIRSYKSTGWTAWYNLNNPLIASTTQATGGANNTSMMTPLRTHEAISSLRPLASSAEAQAGTSDTSVMTPLTTSVMLSSLGSELSKTSIIRASYTLNSTTGEFVLNIRQYPLNNSISNTIDLSTYRVRAMASPGGALILLGENFTMVTNRLRQTSTITLSSSNRNNLLNHMSNNGNVIPAIIEDYTQGNNNVKEIVLVQEY